MVGSPWMEGEMDEWDVMDGVDVFQYAPAEWCRLDQLQALLKMFPRAKVAGILIAMTRFIGYDPVASEEAVGVRRF